MDSIINKIIDFRDLQTGWHYGFGGPISPETIAMALLLYTAAQHKGMSKINASPGIEGEILLSMRYNHTYVEFTINSYDNITFIHEEDEGLEIESINNMNFDAAIKKLQALP